MTRDETRIRELYSKHPFGHFSYGTRRERHNRPLVAFLDSLAKDSLVFDIGCGSGYWSERCLDRGIAAGQIVCLDLAAPVLGPMAARGVNTVCGDVRHLPFADGSAETVISNGMIHATPNPAQAFAELVRATRPGGRIFLAVYNAWNPYFYVVHRASFPLRWLYWNKSRRVLDWTWSAVRPFCQVLAGTVIGAKLDDRTGKTLLMDQVMAPYAHVFTKRGLRRYAREHGCEIECMARTDDFMMLTAVFRRRD